MSRPLIIAAFAVLAQSPGTLALAQTSTVQPKNLDGVLAELGATAIRKVDTDICFPATSEEYEALGKNAVLMLTSSSAHSSELPLRSAYIVANAIRVPLQRIALSEKSEIRHATSGGSEVYFSQVSFYLLPVYLMKLDAHLMVDFSGQRTEFGVTSFSANGHSLDGAPTFVRADDYGTPSEPDASAVRALLLREYPSHFGKPTTR